MDSDKSPNETELTSTMGKMLSVPNKEEKSDSNDFTPTSSTDANTNVVGTPIVSDDPISSTSSDSDPNKQKSQKPEEIDETDRVAAATDETESDFLEISMMSGSSTEKITENVDDLVQDLETLLGESTDTFTVPVRTKDVEPPEIDSSPKKLQPVVSEPTVDDEVTSNTALVEETQSSCSQTVVIESQPEDSTSKLEETLPEDTETKTEENQPEVAKSNIEEIQSEDTGTNIEECQPEDTKSNIEDSQSKDTGTNIEECQPKDTESKIEECQREDTVSKIEECQSEDTKSNIEESQSEDAGTNIEECQPEDTESKIEDCQSEDTKSNIEESQSEHAGTNIEECQHENTASKIEECQSEDTKSKIEESQSEDAGTNIEECQPEDTESKIEECQPEDSESKIEQSQPKETRAEIEATQSEDTDDKIETIGTEIPTIDKNEDNTDEDQLKKEEDIKTIEEFTENIEVPETSNNEKVVVNTTTEPTSLATESIEDTTISEETNKEENIDAIQSELTKAEENIIQPNSELTEKEEGEKCDMEGSEESNSTSNTEEKKLDSLEKPEEESDCSDKDTGSSSENIESQPKNDTILNSETINTKENKCSEETIVIEAKVVENNTVERALVVKEILEEAECSSEDVTPVGMEDDKIKNVDLPSEPTEIEIPKCQSDDPKLSETTIESSEDCIIEGSIKDKQEEISDISTNQNEQLPDCTVMKSCVSNLKEECSVDKISPIEDNSAISEDPGIQNEHKSEDPEEQDDQNIEVHKEQKTEDLVVTSEQKSEDLEGSNEQKSEELEVQNEEFSTKLEETAESVVNIDMSEEKTTNECEKPVVEEKKEDLETTTSKESGSIPIPESEEIEEIQSQDEVVSSDISDDSSKNQLQEQVADTKEDNTSSVEPPSIIEEQNIKEQIDNIKTDIPEVSSSLKDTEVSKEVKDEAISEKINIQEEKEVVLSEESQTKDAEMDLKNKELDQTVLPKEASAEVCVQKVMEKEEMKSVEEAPMPKDVEEFVELPDNSDKGIEELPTCSELTEATESLPVEENAVENPEIVEEKEETISEEQTTNFESEEQEAVANLIEETNKNIEFDEEISEETQAVAHLLEANDNSFSDVETPTQTHSDKKDMIHQQSDVLISGMDNENSNLPNNEGDGSIISEVPTTFEGSMPDMEDILANSPSNLQMDNEENLETMLAVASLQTNIDEQQLSEKEIREMEALRMAVASITDTCEPNYNTLEGSSDIIESVPQEDGDIKSSVIEEPLNPESGVPELLEEEEKVSEDVKLSQQPSTSDILDKKEVVAKSPEVEENKEVIEETVQKSNKDSLPTPIEEEDNEAKSAQKSPKAEEKNAQKEECATKVESLQKEEQLQKPFPKKTKLVEPLTITIDEIEKHREKDKPYSPKVKIKPIKVPDDEVSTTSEAESSVKGSLKMTITKQSDKMHSILKVYNPNEEEDEEEATESHTQLEEPIPKLIIKQKMQQVEQQHSPKMTTRSSRQVYSPTRSSSPRITVKPVVKPNEVSPLKISLKSAIKPDETVNKRHSPKTTRSTKEETSERVASPKVTIKPIIKPVESDQVHSPKLIIKPIAKPSESEVVTPKVTIKPIAKPSEAEKSEISTPKVTIKPIARPSNEAEKFEPTTPKVTIKPIKRPLEDDSNEDRPNPKIIIKPVIKPIEIETEQVLTKLETGRSSPKISIKPIVKPQDCQQTDNEDNKERIVLKINKGNLPTPSKDAKKREHPVEEEKLAKIKLKFSREGGHPHIVQQEEDVNRKLKKDSAHAGDENKKRVHEDKGVVEKNKKLKTGTDSPLTENLRSRHKGSPLQEPDNNTEEDVKIIETKLDSPIVISEDSRSQHSADCVIIDDSSDSLIASATKSQDNMAQSGTKDTAISPAAVGNATTPTPRKRGRPRKVSHMPIKVPLEVREEYIEPAPEPVAEEPPPKKEPPPVAQNTSTRPKRSCRGQNVIATLGIKPRKPRGGGKGKGGKVNMGDRVPMKPKKEPKLSKARLKLLQKSAEEQLKEPNLETDENQPSTSSSVKKPESPIVISTESEEDEKQVTEDAKSIEDTSKVAVASPDSTQKITEPTTITEIQEIETEAISSSLPTESKIPKRKSYGRRGKSKGRGKYQKLAVEESNQEVESSTQDTSLTITEDVVDVVEETNKDIETSDSVSPNFDKTRTKSTDKRKLSVEKEETVKKVKVETCVVEKVFDKCEESTEKKEEKVEEVKEGEQELTSLTNKEDKKESSTPIPESKQDQPDPDTKQQTPPLPADTNKAEDRVSLEKKLNLLLPESITEPNPILPEVKTDSTPPEVETNVISEVLPVLAPPVSESVSPGGKVATATASSSKIPEVVMVDEETRMSADANSRAQTPARQIAAPSVDMVEESQSSVQSSATTESSKTSSRPNRSRIEINHDSLGDIISADQLAEYYWNNNGPFMLQEQVAQFLGIKSFKRKYPNITRRMVDMQERDFIRESALATEAMCDLGLTAVNSADILDIMFTDFQDKYEEYCKHQREKQAKELINKQKALNQFSNQEKSKLDITEQAVQSAAQWNVRFNKVRKEQRKASMDLQTLTVHYPKGRMKQINKPKIGHYPVALVPGQFTDYYQEFTPTEINNLPLNTMCYNEINIVAPDDSDDSDDNSDSDSDSSTSSSGSSGSSSSIEDCKSCKTNVKKIPVK